MIYFYIVGYIVCFFCWYKLAKNELNNNPNARWAQITVLRILQISILLLVYPLSIGLCLFSEGNVLYDYLKDKLIVKL